jgi:hypothetical protein
MKSSNEFLRRILGSGSARFEFQFLVPTVEFSSEFGLYPPWPSPFPSLLCMQQYSSFRMEILSTEHIPQFDIFLDRAWCPQIRHQEELYYIRESGVQCDSSG